MAEQDPVGAVASQAVREPRRLVDRVKLLVERFRALDGVPELCDLAWELCGENEALKRDVDSLMNTILKMDAEKAAGEAVREPRPQMTDENISRMIELSDKHRHDGDEFAELIRLFEAYALQRFHAEYPAGEAVREAPPPNLLEALQDKIQQLPVYLMEGTFSDQPFSYVLVRRSEVQALLGEARVSWVQPPSEPATQEKCETPNTTSCPGVSVTCRYRFTRSGLIAWCGACLRAEILRLRAAGESVCPRQGWQPIETIPDTPVLVCWSADGPGKIEIVGGRREYLEIMGYGEPPAIAWMPLPSAPTDGDSTPNKATS